MCSINKKYLHKGLQTCVQTGNHSLTRTLMHLRVSNVHVPGPGDETHTDLQTIASSEDRPEPPVESPLLDSSFEPKTTHFLCFCPINNTFTLSQHLCQQYIRSHQHSNIKSVIFTTPYGFNYHQQQPLVSRKHRKSQAEHSLRRCCPCARWARLLEACLTIIKRLPVCLMHGQDRLSA